MIKVTSEDAMLSCKSLCLPLGAASPGEEHRGERYEEAAPLDWTIWIGTPKLLQGGDT